MALKWQSHWGGGGAGLKFEPLGWCLWMVSALSRVSHRLLSGLFLTLPLVGPPLARHKGQYLDQGYALGSLPRDGDGQVSAEVTVVAWPLCLGCRGRLWLSVFFPFLSFSFYPSTRTRI